MESFVLANLINRKTRTLLSIIGISIGLVLMLLTNGLVRGFERSQAARNSAVTAEIMLRPPGGAFTLGSSLGNIPTMPVGVASQISSIPGVAHAVPLCQILTGPDLVDGVEYGELTKVSDARIVKGRPPVADGEVMIDQIIQARKNRTAGDRIKILGANYLVVGIYSPESLARFKVSLGTMQRFTNRPGTCSLVLIKTINGASAVDIANRIKTLFPDYSLMLTKDLPALYSRGTPALATFLNVVLCIAGFISLLVILLCMYATVIERTHQIGILKSLGASKSWIAFEIEKEAVVLSLFGVIAGIGLSFLGQLVIETTTTLTVVFEPHWLLLDLVVTVAAAAAGALYPALRAASQDPVAALSYD